MAGGSTFAVTFPFIFGDGTSFSTELPPALRAPGVREVVSSRQIVSLHTIGGVQLYQFLSDDYTALKWTRELRETSVLDMTVPVPTGQNRLPDITPWLHWLSVWDDRGEELYWTGPIQRVEANSESMSLSARDMSALAARTRCPMAKRWDAADPAEIAGELWAAMVELHGLQTRAIVRPDPRGDRFDFQTIADAKMVDDAIAELVNLGLYWSVVAGVPVLGPAPTAPISALGENDFVNGGLAVTRDGSQSFNDVLLRAKDNIARARVPMGGLNLQTTVTLDSMFSASNAERAVQQLARYSGVIHDSVSVPDGAVLHPQAPVHISQLVPSVRTTIEAFGLIAVMELTKVSVECSQGSATVGVSLASVNDEPPELLSSDGVTLS